VLLQAVEDVLRGSGFLPGWVQVFHAQQPLTAVMAGIKVAGNCGDQGAQMQRAGG
jgi:hypothetical protein